MTVFLAVAGSTLLAVLLGAVGLWSWARRHHLHRVVDVAWGLGFVLVTLVAYAVGASGRAEWLRRDPTVFMVGLWGLRLAAHIAWRNRGTGEDPRYAELLARAPGDPDRYALRSIYLTQAAALWFVSLPVQVAMVVGGPLGALGVLGIVIWAVGMFFETVGDAQLARFRRDPANRGRVLDTGLWRYTRHPNYFGDALVWWGVFLRAADRPVGWLTVLSPLLMTWFLARKTGKPLLEKRMATTRPGYAEYVERTSGFMPLPPRSAAARRV